jgi:uncharacterized damage-inducible protein DinB
MMQNHQTIADVYTANEQIRSRFLSVVESIAANEAELRTEGEKWSIKEILEHLSMVEAGALRICTKLLEGAKAAGKPSDGKLRVSATFRQKAVEIATIKVEAPDRVQPSGEQSVEESLERLRQVRAAFEPLRNDLESYDLSSTTFPHPFLGDLTAAEWLIVLGGHEARHTAQIERILTATRQ